MTINVILGELGNGVDGSLFADHAKEWHLEHCKEWTPSWMHAQQRGVRVTFREMKNQYKSYWKTKLYPLKKIPRFWEQH